MSDTNNIYTTITAPQLTDTKYGENLDTQFNNINSNFTKLGSGAFTKGDKGDCTKAYRLEITDKVKEAYKDDYKKGIIAQAIYMGLDQDGLGPIPISKDTKIEVSVIINDIENPILKGFWSLYVEGKTSWEKSKIYLSDLQNILIDIIPFFYIDKKFYSENLNMPKGEKDKTGIYTFNKLFNRDGLIIIFTQNNIQQSIYYDNSKETWCWALGNNETGIPIYPTYKDRILKPYGKDLSVHHCYYMSKVEHAEGTSEYTLHISPYNGNTSVTDLTCQIYLDDYHSVHARRFISTSSWATDMRSNMITAVKKKDDNAGLTGNILAERNITAKGDLTGDNVRGNLIEVKSGGTVNITENATLNINKNATLKVDGKSTFNDITINGKTTFNGNTYMTSNLSVQADFDADRIQTRYINIEIQNSDGNPIESKFEDGKIIFTLPV